MLCLWPFVFVATRMSFTTNRHCIYRTNISKKYDIQKSRGLMSQDIFLCFFIFLRKEETL
ncbi:hypothetical protein C6557_29765 [Bacillus wiedmannii]|nr:hypothetical protein C6557_29765 [Bacillus wiedmannii]